MDENFTLPDVVAEALLALQCDNDLGDPSDDGWDAALGQVLDTLAPLFSERWSTVSEQFAPTRLIRRA